MSKKHKHRNANNSVNNSQITDNFVVDANQEETVVETEPFSKAIDDETSQEILAANNTETNLFDDANTSVTSEEEQLVVEQDQTDTRPVFNYEAVPKRKQRFEKNVSIKQCVTTIIASVVALLVLLIPVDLVNGTMALNTMPIIGDESFFVAQLQMAYGFNFLAGLDIAICETIGMVLNYSLYGYIGILALDILFSLLLIATKSVIARRIFKFFTIIFGFVMLAIALCQLLHIGGFIGLTIGQMQPENNIVIPDMNGLIFSIAVFFVSIVMIKRQFNWFARWY